MQDTANPQPPMQVFNIGAALRDQVPLNVINKELATRKNFDYDAAFRDLTQFRKNELLQGGLSEQNILDEDLALFADEILLEKLSDGAYAREADPKQRGMMQAMLVDVPAGAGFIKGAVEGFKRTPGPIPVKLGGAGLGAIGLSTAGYTPGEIFLRGDPTGLTDYEGIYPSEPLPSQRAEIEAARTYTGTLLSLLTAGAVVKQGVVDLGADSIARNIENMGPGLKQSFSSWAKKLFVGQNAYPRRWLDLLPRLPQKPKLRELLQKQAFYLPRLPLGHILRKRQTRTTPSLALVPKLALAPFLRKELLHL